MVDRPGTWRVFLLIAITVAVYRWLGVGASLFAILGFMLCELFIPPVRHRKFPDQDKQVVDNELGIFGERLPGRRARFEPALKVGRNDPCPCGSGAKYKRFCGRASV